jgi:hypothetical protein
MRNSVPWLLLLISVAIALALRLIVWHWHEFYPPGGDEQEYLAQALMLLREHRYEELRLMRPPLYGVFLAGCIVLVDSFIHRLRLVQALISAATVIPMWLLTKEIARTLAPARSLSPADTRQGVEPQTTQPTQPTQRENGAPAIAALLTALSYTLADHATELLTETLFLAGLTTLFWLLVRGASPAVRGGRSAATGGVVLGLLCLVRSVALPLLPLGTLWLLLARRGGSKDGGGRWWLPALLYAACAIAVILPWTVRNTITYGAVIVIDTTGAENLWLDNDPAGREAVKAQLYALGDDRATRQHIATQRGIQTFVDNPLHVVEKAWGELLDFFALEYADDMRSRPAIWVPPGEVWARLVLGDGLFLLVLLCGAVGLAPGSALRCPRRLADPRWLMGAWVLYTLLTAMVFHVELRYRLPLFPALVPYAALLIEQGIRRTGKSVSHGSTIPPPSAPRPPTPEPCLRHKSWIGPLLIPLLIITLTLLHVPYPLLAWQLGAKHMHLARAEHALMQGNAAAAQRAAQSALNYDPRSVLARSALARSHILTHDPARAETLLREAIDLLPSHPHAHLLLGDLLRQRAGWGGNTDTLAAAREQFRYETASLQDVQAWCWQWHTTPPPTTLDIGGGLDLGMIRGFHAHREQTHWRWTRAQAWIRLSRPPGAASLVLRMASGRPEGAAAPRVTVAVDGHVVLQGHLLAREWEEVIIPLPDRGGGGAVGRGANSSHPSSTLVVEIRSDTFPPRNYDPASDDGRILGIMVDHASVVSKR